MLSTLTELTRKELGTQRHGATLIIAAGSILVNAANEGCTGNYCVSASELLGGFGVDEQINRAAGYELKEERKTLGGCQTGSYQHKKCKNIIHAVGPVYRIKFGSKFGSTPDCLAVDQETYLKSKDPLLVSAYKRSMELAHGLNAKTIGFTLLSAGVFKGERELRDILEIGVRSVLENCYEGLEAVTMVAWTEEEQKVLVEVVEKLA